MRIEYPVTFFYYKDLEPIIPFYKNVLGLGLWLDQGWCKIFGVNESAYVGLVDEAYGSLKAACEKPVMLTLVVDDVHAWHRHLREHGVDGITDIKVNQEVGITAFLCKDPGGYTIEIQKFNPKQ